MPDEASTLPDVEVSAAKPANKRTAPARKPAVQATQMDDVLAALEDIQERVTKVERRLFWMMLSGWLKILIIVVPIILGILYLPPLIQDSRSLFTGSNGEINVIQQFQELFGVLPQ